jgi:LmbE family N-acetylglucosaminyl deacetylase
MAHPNTDHTVDITDVFDRKLAALRAHVSQTGHMGEQLETLLRGWGGQTAVAGGLGEDRLAEAFRVVATG